MPAITTRWLGFAAVLTALLASSPASSQTVEIDPAAPIGPTIQRAGWDIKAWPLRLNSNAEVTRLYRNVDANFLRVPIFANAHNANGSVDASQYEREINAMKAVRAGRQDVEIYASLKLLGGNTFPDWVSEPTAEWGAETGGIFGNTVDRPNPEHYATMIAGYVKYMQDNGIKIDYLGLNNETEGAVPVDRYIGTYDLLPAALTAAGVTTANQDFQFVGPDSFGLPTAENFMRGLRNAGRLDTIDFASSHYYPQHTSGNESDWEDLQNLSGGLPLWHTEVHMPGESRFINDLSQSVRDSLSVLFASFRNGVDSYIWWEPPNTIDNIREIVKTQVTDTTRGAAPVFTTPSYDGKGDPDGQPLYQAFVDGDQVTLWIVNPGNELTNLPVNLLSSALDASVTGVGYLAPDGDESWNPSETLTLGFTPSVDGLGFTIDSIAAQSIGLVSFSLSSGLACDLDGNGQCDLLDLELLVDDVVAGSAVAGDIATWLADASDPANPYLSGAKTFMIGDVDLDGKVDSTDLGLLLNNFNSTTTPDWMQGNLNGDGAVDSVDLGQLLNNFNFSSAANTAAVPEPSSLGLFLLATLGLISCGRGRRQG